MLDSENHIQGDPKTIVNEVFNDKFKNIYTSGNIIWEGIAYFW